MSASIGFLIGILIGGALGYFCCAILTLAQIGDRHLEGE